VEFAEETAASASIAAMKSGDFELGGLRLRASRALVGGDMPEGMSILEKIPMPDASPMSKTTQRKKICLIVFLLS
jgi:hypothetical protein